MKFKLVVLFSLCFICLYPQKTNTVSKVWVSDNGNGTYTNPILHADYSDPDVINVGRDYYMTASSFNCVPGLPVLHSEDLVNWQLVNYALPRLSPSEVFDKTQHGKGVWAPCIRFHKGEFYIYYPDPDFGIYMVKTKDPKGIWSEPVLVKEGKGLIDPSPLWDDDGNAYLVYAFAGSRAGIKSLLVVCTMNVEGTKANNDEVMIIDGHRDEPTIEGPKFYKRNGYYYIFAPAGGVSTGWQTVLRAKNIYGPYEKRRVMEQGNTKINGPHQGAWVHTTAGEDWFFHFQDKGVYGRVVHLQPMSWVDEWPVIGYDRDGDGIGEPVEVFKKPEVAGVSPIMTPPDSDEFNEANIGLQWQWHANPQVSWAFPTSMGYLTMFCRNLADDVKNLYGAPNLLLQKFPSEKFTATSKITFNPRLDGERTGLLIMGLNYSYLGLKRENGKLYISQNTCLDADKGNIESESETIELTGNLIYLQVKVEKEGRCNFYFSEDGEKFTKIGSEFKAREGKWIGAKMGFFAMGKGVTNDSGSVDIDWFRINK